MKLSWSHKLFLRINRSLGGRPLLEKVMRISAHWGIYVLATLAFFWVLVTFEFPEVKIYIKLLMTAGAFSLATSYCIAILWPHRRPIAEFPAIRQLLVPLNTWKSFPSDHTLISFVFVFVTWFVGTPWYMALVLFILGVFVAMGRVYVGVHYPRDIVGGFVLAWVYSVLAFWLLGEVTQPLYEWVTQIYG